MRANSSPSGHGRGGEEVTSGRNRKHVVGVLINSHCRCSSTVSGEGRWRAGPAGAHPSPASIIARLRRSRPRRGAQRRSFSVCTLRMAPISRSTRSSVAGSEKTSASPWSTTRSPRIEVGFRPHPAGCRLKAGLEGVVGDGRMEGLAGRNPPAIFDAAHGQPRCDCGSGLVSRLVPGWLARPLPMSLDGRVLVPQFRGHNASLQPSGTPQEQRARCATRWRLASNSRYMSVKGPARRTRLAAQEPMEETDDHVAPRGR